MFYGSAMFKILIGVVSCHQAVYPDVLSRIEPPSNAPCLAAARATWAKEAISLGVDVKFFFGRGAARESLQDEVFLDCDDSYDGLVDKVTAMCKYADDADYDFLLKVDIDSYVNVPNLLKSEFFEWDYAGRGWGLGYLLSRKAIKIVAAATQRRSWAEDSHVLRTLFAYGAQPNHKIRLYGDGRYVFLPNMSVDEIPLLDTEFIAVNPMTPERMAILDKTHSLYALVPITFAIEDLWTAFPDRVQHSHVLNAFSIHGSKFPLTYEEWRVCNSYDRQPYLDWTDLVNACLETNQMASCPSFQTWMQPLEWRGGIMEWARGINAAASKRLETLSKLFKDADLEGRLL